MSGFKFLNQTRKTRRGRSQGTDMVTEQVKKVLEDADQKLILMVRN